MPKSIPKWNILWSFDNTKSLEILAHLCIRLKNFPYGCACVYVCVSACVFWLSACISIVLHSNYLKHGFHYLCFLEQIVLTFGATCSRGGGGYSYLRGYPKHNSFIALTNIKFLKILYFHPYLCNILGPICF